MSRLRGGSKQGAPFSGLKNFGAKILSSVGIEKDSKPPRDAILEGCKNQLNLLKKEIIKIREQFSNYAEQVLNTAESCVTLSRSVGDFYKNENQPGRSKSIKTFKDVQDNIATHAVKIFQEQLHSQGGLASELGDWLDTIKKIFEKIIRAEDAQQASHSTKKRLKDLQNDYTNQQNRSNKSNWMSNIGNNNENNLDELQKKIKKYSDVQRSLSNDFKTQRNNIQQSVNEMIKEKYIIFDRIYVQILECQSLYFEFEFNQTAKFKNAINYYRNQFPKSNTTFKPNKDNDIVINKSKKTFKNVPKNPAPKSPKNKNSTQSNGSNNKHKNGNISSDSYINGNSHNSSVNNSFKSSNKTSDNNTPSKLQRKTTNLLGFDMDITTELHKDADNDNNQLNNERNKAISNNVNNNGSNNQSNGNNKPNNGHDEDDLLFGGGFGNTNDVSNNNVSNNNGNNDNDKNKDDEWGNFFGGTHDNSNDDNNDNNHGNNNNDMDFILTPNQNNNHENRKFSLGDLFGDKKGNNNPNDDPFGGMFNESTPKNPDSNKKHSLNNFMNDMEKKNNSLNKPKSAPHRPSKTAWEDLPPEERLKLINANMKQENEDKQERRNALNKHESRLDKWEFDNPVSKTRRNVRTLLTKLQTVLWPELNWKPIGLNETLQENKCKKAFRKALRVVHPDPSKNRGDTIEQQAICERIFTALDEAWKKEFGK